MSKTKKQAFNYAFSKIPNNDEGREFVRLARKYLNRERFTLDVYGQNVRDELRGTGCTYWGQKISESKNLRVYVRDQISLKRSRDLWRKLYHLKEFNRALFRKFDDFADDFDIHHS